MLKPCAALACLCLVSCLAPVEGADELFADSSAEPVIQLGGVKMSGPCVEACEQAAADDCDIEGQCDGSSFPIVYCGKRYLTCDEALHALDQSTVGLVYCYRGCENLH